MTDFEQDWIEKRAYALWEEEGYPAGRDSEHWDKARQEFDVLVSAKAIDQQTAPTSDAELNTELPPASEKIAAPNLPKRRSRKTTSV